MKETGGAQTSGLLPRLPPPPHWPRYLPYPSCQVVADQQNKVNHGPTRVLAISANEGVLRCCSECVQVFACSRHSPCLFSNFFQIQVPSDLRWAVAAVAACPCWCARCLPVSLSVFRLLFQALLHFEGCSFLLPVRQGDSNWLNLLLPFWCTKTRLLLQI